MYDNRVSVSQPIDCDPKLEGRLLRKINLGVRHTKKKRKHCDKS